MISRAAIVPFGVTLRAYQEDNVATLIRVMNNVRAEYGMPMRVTSGFRTRDEQMRIDPAHPDSMHTRGCAVDIYDPDPQKRLWNWCTEHMELLVELGVWLEDRLYSPNHVHFQTKPPHSGTRIFKP